MWDEGLIVQHRECWMTNTSSSSPTANLVGQREGHNRDQKRRGAHASRLLLCAEHVRQLGGESPLLNLMEVKS